MKFKNLLLATSIALISTNSLLAAPETYIEQKLPLPAMGDFWGGQPPQDLTEQIPSDTLDPNLIRLTAAEAGYTGDTDKLISFIEEQQEQLFSEDFTTSQKIDLLSILLSHNQELEKIDATSKLFLPEMAFQCRFNLAINLWRKSLTSIKLIGAHCENAASNGEKSLLLDVTSNLHLPSDELEFLLALPLHEMMFGIVQHYLQPYDLEQQLALEELLLIRGHLLEKLHLLIHMPKAEEITAEEIRSLKSFLLHTMSTESCRKMIRTLTQKAILSEDELHTIVEYTRRKEKDLGRVSLTNPEILKQDILDFYESYQKKFGVLSDIQNELPYQNQEDPLKI